MKTDEKVVRRSGFTIMRQMIGLIKPLGHIMFLAVLLGVLGFLCAIFLTILATMLMGKFISSLQMFNVGMLNLSGLPDASTFFIIMIVMAVLRGVLHYGEQYCNHFIAFKLLAIIRHKVFAVLRRLCPAKLEGRDKGNLISLITTDIELLEVFYAHTISPICIAFVTSLIMVIFIGSYSLLAGVLALIAYITIGVIIPIINGKKGGNKGMAFRNQFGDLNSFVLDSLNGLDETIQYGQGEKRRAELSRRSISMNGLSEELSDLEGSQRSVTNYAIVAFSILMVFLAMTQYQSGVIDAEGLLVCISAMMGSFGPVVALASLSNNLNQTLASGERVIKLLEEEPQVDEIPVSQDSDYKGATDFSGANLEGVTFAYEDEVILDDFSLNIEKGKILGIYGASGSGKSTMLKLIMRFWQVDDGRVVVSGEDVNKIPTTYLRDTISYVTQETHLFHDSIRNNVAVGKIDATDEEIVEACKKASIHDFISSLPDGYETKVGELGDTLSGGEKQRIGVARAFLHNSPFILMDEPTSNLDSLNEGIILKSLRESAENKTVVLVSHRESTMNVADQKIKMDNGRIS